MEKYNEAKCDIGDDSLVLVAHTLLEGLRKVARKSDTGQGGPLYPLRLTDDWILK